MRVWVVSWAYDNDPETIDSVWSTEQAAHDHASTILDDESGHLRAFVRAFEVDTVVAGSAV